MSLFHRAHAELPESPERSKLALEAALRVSEIAASATALPDALPAMVTAAVQLLSADQGSIMLLEERERTLVLVASAGAPAAPVGCRLPIGESVAGRVLATGTPLRLGQVDRDAFVNFVPKQHDIQSSVVVPLRVLGRPIGVLSLALTGGAMTFTDEDVRVAQMFADQAAAVIHRAKLHEKAEHRSASLMALLESSRKLFGSLDLDSLLQHILDGGARLTGAKEGFACLFDHTAALSHGVFRGIDKPAIRAVLEAEEVRRAIEAVDLSYVEIRGTGRLVAAGLRTSGGTKGVLVLATGAASLDERADLLRMFAQQCGSALGAAELHVAVQRKESELSSIIQAVPQPIVLADSEDRVVAVNPAAEIVFSVSSVFLAGAPVAASFNNEAVERLLMNEGDVQTEVIAGNPPRTFKVRAADVRVPGAPMGRLLIMDDVTAEREISQTHHDFVAMIGHELRTPLTIIKGFAKTLLKRVESASLSEARETLGIIDSKAVQLERLIEDLLYVSKIESREASLRIERVDVAQLVENVVGELLVDYADREVLLEMPQALAWPCDETKIALVIRHLVENALKYSHAPNPVVVRAGEEGGELHVDIVDRGIGIVSSDIPYIFDRFRQVDASSTRQHGGTGVGLYLCAQLIKVHEGRIWIDSTWGKGSTFSFALPARSLQGPVVALQGKRLAGASDAARPRAVARHEP